MAGWLKAAAMGAKALAKSPLAGNIAGAAATGYMDRLAQDRAFAQNKAWWLERFEKEAQYNSPVQQKARMAAAGLNPALMYQGGQTGGTASGGAAQGKIAERYQMTELAKMSAEVKNIQANTAKQQAEAGLIGGKTEGQKTQNLIGLQNLAIKEVEAMNVEQKTKNDIAKQLKELIKAQEEVNLIKQKIKREREATGGETWKALYYDELRQTEKNKNYKFDKITKEMIDKGIDPGAGIIGNLLQMIGWGMDAATQTINTDFEL